MMIGASCQVRGLMVPYLILQMFVIIIMILVGIGVTIALCFFNAIVGAIAMTPNNASGRGALPLVCSSPRCRRSASSPPV